MEDLVRIINDKTVRVGYIIIIEIKMVPLSPQNYKKGKRYLKFPKAYKETPRRGYDRFRSKNHFYDKAN